MSSYLDNVQVNTAITDNTKLDLGHTHITTANFMQLNPILCKEMVPGESTDVNLMTFSRLQPLTVPTFGRCNIKERAFFVPMRTIFRGWNDFITDTPHVYSDAKGSVSIQQSVPVVTNLTFIGAFLSGWSYSGPGGNLLTGNFVTVVSNPLTTAFDVVYNVTSGGSTTATYYAFTEEGRQFNKIIQSLGYKIVWDDRNTDTYSALPLLAFAKVYMDWYYPQAYANTGKYVDIMGLLNRDESTLTSLTSTDVVNIISLCSYSNFDSDYFTSAWDQPNSPNVGVYSSFKITNIDSVSDRGLWMSTSTGLNNDVRGVVTNGTQNINGGSSTVMDNVTAPFISPYADNSVSGGNFGSPSPISEYMLHSLHALTDYMKRHQLVGARAMDRYLARFGKVLSAEKLNRCNYIGSKNIPIQFGDVTSTADTANATLGSFAGKGIAFEQNFSFDFSTDEYGYLMVMSSIIPAASIWQGLDRKVMHISKLDFWTPEFDQLGTQAISTREVFTDNLGAVMSSSGNDYMGFYKTVFGFAPRYGEYKYMNDQITGDFVINTLNNMDANNSAWHLGRNITVDDFNDGSGSDYANLKHRLAFMQGIVDHRQFNRIFVYNDVTGSSEDENNMPDPFTMIYDFQMVSQAPMKPLYETYDFEDKGRKVTEQNNGVKVN